MGTRADFWVGTDPDTMEWLGSIAWGGHPEGICRGTETCDPKESPILSVTLEGEYRKALSEFFSDRDDVTLPEMGWPWPWEDSGLTDYSYTFDEGRVLCSCFGSLWRVAMEAGGWKDEEEPRRVMFPNMKDVQNVAFGKRSGLIVIGAPVKDSEDRDFSVREE